MACLHKEDGMINDDMHKYLPLNWLLFDEGVLQIAVYQNSYIEKKSDECSN